MTGRPAPRPPTTVGLSRPAGRPGRGCWLRGCVLIAATVLLTGCGLSTGAATGPGSNAPTGPPSTGSSTPASTSTSTSTSTPASVPAGTLAPTGTTSTGTSPSPSTRPVSSWIAPTPFPMTGTPQVSTPYTAPIDRLPKGCPSGTVTITHRGVTGLPTPTLCVHTGAVLEITLTYGAPAWSPLQITPAGAATVTRTATPTQSSRTATVKVTGTQPFDIAASTGYSYPTSPVGADWTLHVTVRP